jgi:Ca2+-binding RTX toxin-like protein
MAAMDGNDLDNELTGGDENDTIRGFGGKDRLIGKGGNDTIDGGTGEDLLAGGNGNDSLNGGDNSDILFGGEANLDAIAIGFDFRVPPAFSLTPDADPDTLNGGEGGDIIFAGYGDTVDGGGGENMVHLSYLGAPHGVTPSLQSHVSITNAVVRWMQGSNFADTFSGPRVLAMGGDDQISVLAGVPVYIDGGDGNDRINIYREAFSSSFDGLVLGGAGNDTITSDASGNLAGGAGADVLRGGNASDILSADRKIGFDNFTDVDQLFAGAGNDFIFSGFGDIVDGGEGFDTVGLSYVGATQGISGDTAILHKGQPLVAGGGTFQNVERFSDIAMTQFDDKMVIGDQHDPAVVRSWDGNDHLVGQEVSITMYGGNGDDLLVGGRANDVVYGETGNDKLIGFFGADELWGGSGSDIFYFTTIDATDRIADFERGSDRIDLTAIDADTARAGTQAFTLIGSAAFSGKAGELRVYSGGNDYFVAGDINGDGTADLLINLGSAQIGSGDFIL